VKILFFNIPAHGHVNPTLPVVAELVRRGQHVIYYNSDWFRDAITATGAEFRAYPALTTTLGSEAAMNTAVAQGSVVVTLDLLTQATEALMPFAVEEIRREKPDAVVHDSLCMWGNYAARVMDALTIGSFAIFALGHGGSIDPRSMLVELKHGAIPKLGRLRALQRNISERYRLGGLKLLDAFNSTGIINLVFTTRDLQPSGSDFDDSYTFVGTSIAARPHAPDFPFEAIRRAPVITIARGTIMTQNKQFYRTCIDAFADHPGTVILATGRDNDLGSLMPFPDNMIVRPLIPQLEVLQRSDVFVTHGGMNSVHEALYYGVPLVVVPGQPEQAMVAQRVVAKGAGVALGMVPPLGQVTAQALRSAVDTVLGDARYQENARALGENLRGAGGYTHAAQVIQAFAGQRTVLKQG